MFQIQLSLTDLFSSASNDTQNINNTVQATIANILHILYYFTLTIIMIGIFYYGATLALGKNPSETKTKLLYVSLALIVVYILPKILDYIATGQGAATTQPQNPGPVPGPHTIIVN